MDDTRLIREAETLRSAAQRLEHGVGAHASAAAVATALRSMEHTVQALGRACETATRSFVPGGEDHEPWSARFGRAAEQWPATHGGPAPTYEEQARLMAALHDAAASLRFAARSTATAHDLVARHVQYARATTATSPSASRSLVSVPSG